jgi:hypothetical protein
MPTSSTSDDRGSTERGPVPSVNVYIDGYNFYCSINHRSTLRLGWCNFIKLSHRLADRAFGGHRLGAVKYFTAHIPEHLQLNSGELERQKLWLEALRLETRNNHASKSKQMLISRSL